MASPRPVELPPTYYLDYFRYLIDFVEKHYGSLLSEAEVDFITRFRDLPEQARCLFVRLSNRQGIYFRLNKLNYAEIDSLSDCLEVLERAKFISRPVADQSECYLSLLDLFSRPELVALAKELNLSLIGVSKLKKEELVAQVASLLPYPDFLAHTQANLPIIQQGCCEELEMLRFLFFGDLDSDMTSFVVRDLGNLRFEEFSESIFTAQFQTRQQALEKMRMIKTYRLFKHMRDVEVRPAEEIVEWFCQWAAENPVLEPCAQPIFDKLAVRLGTFLEKNKLYSQALRAFQHTNRPPSRERQVRLLQKLKKLPEAEILCRQMQFHPYNADEKFFALDFLEKMQAAEAKKRVSRSTTRWLKGSESINVPISWQHRVEQGVAEYYRNLGYQAFRSENYLWCGLFGLLFWDIIFDTDHQAIHNPLQAAPSDFYSPDFYVRREEKLLNRIDLLQKPGEAEQFICSVYEQKMGLMNPMVGWHESLLDLVLGCVRRVTASGLGAVLLEMARNLRENTHGFPDLFVWNEYEYWFIEVKSPNDHLSAQQLYWMDFFREVKIAAKVQRVIWAAE